MTGDLSLGSLVVSAHYAENEGVASCLKCSEPFVKLLLTSNGESWRQMQPVIVAGHAAVMYCLGTAPARLTKLVGRSCISLQRQSGIILLVLGLAVLGS